VIRADLLLLGFFGEFRLEGKSIAIQGLGSVGSKLAHFLFWGGAKLYLSDLDPEKLQAECLKFGATAVTPQDIYRADVDIFCPCAMGGVINQETILRLKCKAIAGAANNQLKTPEDGVLLQEKGILFAPDFVINAGGIINASAEFHKGGYSPNWAREKTAHIYDTLMEIFQTSKKTGKCPALIAEEIALKKLA
jgi:leucine dehydrogenase